MAPNADGPDISHWNPVADWDAIPQYRLFSTKATEGRTFKSPTFDENWRQMRRRKFEFRGCYHWIRSDSSMADQVANLRRALAAHGGLQVGEFVQLDWETTPNIPNVTVAQVEEWMRLAEAEWPGRIIVYASDWVPGFAEWRARHPNTPLWYANYNTGSKSTGGWAECAKWKADVWQWTSSAPVPGIADPTCDQNHVFNWGAFYAITATAPLPPPTPPTTLVPLGDDMKLVNPPTRLYDSRANGGQPTTLWAIPCGVPGALAVFATVTAIPVGQSGFVSTGPGTSCGNFGPTVASANTTIIPVQPDGVIVLASNVPVHLCVDLCAVYGA